jgi:hypothetical protein
MGKRGKRRRARERLRQQQVQAPTEQPIINSEKVKHYGWLSLVQRWCIFGAPIFIGAGVSLMPYFFRVGVGLIYGGAALLCIELAFQRFNSWMRVCGIFIVLVAAGGFTRGVVLKPAPVVVRSEMVPEPYAEGVVLWGIKWSSDLRDLRVTIENPSDDDYENIDVTVRPDFPDTPIIAIGQVSNIPGVTFMSTELQAWQPSAGPPIIRFDSTTGHTVGDNWRFSARKTDGGSFTPLQPFPNHYRFRCEKLPHRETLEVSIAIAEKDMPKGKIGKVWLRGQYRAYMRTHKIDTSVPVH